MFATSPLLPTQPLSNDLPARTGAKDREVPAGLPPSGQLEGRLSLLFAHSPAARRTVLKVVEQQPPLRVVRAFPLPDGAVLTHLHNLSGGVLGGDQLRLALEVGPGARAQVTSTGATRIYRQRAGRSTAVQSIHARVAEGGLLEYLPDPLIPFAGSSYRQHVRIELQPGAGLFWWEAIAPGREALGECFEYERLEMSFELTAAGKPAALECYELDPRCRPVSSIARLGPYRHFVSFYICRVGVDSAYWAKLERKLAEAARTLSRPGETLWGASTLPASGLIVRGLSLNGHTLAAGLLTFWQIARQSLYGQAAIPPRKLY